METTNIDFYLTKLGILLTHIDEIENYNEDDAIAIREFNKDLNDGEPHWDLELKAECDDILNMYNFYKNETDVLK